jgi:hypothetical protein
MTHQSFLRGDSPHQGLLNHAAPERHILVKVPSEELRKARFRRAVVPAGRRIRRDVLFVKPQ